ncbi:MAG: DUF4384 domain-containing protein [Acidobacteria bacterium]|nr:DUF4384 domain-containing protein [Acidobacteriota bacterium]
MFRKIFRSLLYASLILSAAISITPIPSLPVVAQQQSGQQKDVGLSWEKPETILRPKKGPQQSRIRAPLLALRWQLLILDKRNREQPVDPKTQYFADGDYMRLAVQLNQNGYFYVIKHTLDNNDQRSPLLLISNKYEVAKDEVVEIPDPKSSEYRRNDKSWWKIGKRVKSDVITIIFTRDRIDRLAASGLSSSEGDVVDEQLVFELTRQSSNPEEKLWSLAMQKNSNLRGILGEHVKFLRNPDPRNNEVLVERIEGRHVLRRGE